MASLPEYHAGGPVPRRLAIKVFAVSDRAHRQDREALEDRIAGGGTITIAEAQALWEAHPRAKMTRLPSGPFVFWFPTPEGFARVTLWGAP